MLRFLRSFFVALALLGGALTVQAEPREKMTQITVQRTWCYGVCPIDSFTLNADGSAIYNSVRGGLKPTGRYNGKSDTKTFQEVGDWLEEQNFFALRSEVGQGNIDASDFIVSVQRDFRTFTVAFRHGEFNEIREKFEARLLPIPKTIDWQKDEAFSDNGVQGRVWRSFAPAEKEKELKRTVMRFAVVRVRPYGNLKQEYTAITDQEGRFQFFLPPGRYSLEVSTRNETNFSYLFHGPYWFAESLSVTVNKGAFAPAEITLKSL